MIPSCPCSSQRPRQERMSKQPDSNPSLPQEFTLSANKDCSGTGIANFIYRRKTKTSHQGFNGCLFQKPGAFSIPLAALGYGQLQIPRDQPHLSSAVQSRPPLLHPEGLSHPERLGLSISSGCTRHHTDRNATVSMEK